MIEGDGSELFGALNAKLDEEDELKWWHIFFVHPIMCLTIAAGAALVIYAAVWG